MHWTNGRFHGNIHVGETIYVTDHKHIAVFGDNESVGFSSFDTNTYVYGQDVGISCTDNFYADSESGSDICAIEYIHIEAGSDYIKHGNTTGNGIEIISKNGTLLLNTDEDYIDIKSYANSINITGGTYINLNSNSGITVNNASYGTTLPTTNNVEGKIFFKLIS